LGRVWGSLTGAEKIMILEGVVNSCFEDLEGRMTLIRVRKMFPQVVKKRGTNEWR